VPDTTWGEVGVAFVVRRPGTPDVQPGQLSSFLAAKLAKYKIPKDYVFIETLPRTAYGKVVKGDLRDRYLGDLGKGHRP
jgi:fatty-acyl-CoA synthase